MELVEEAKRYHLDIAEISSTKRRGSGIVDLDDGWKLFYSGDCGIFNKYNGNMPVTSQSCLRL